VRLVEISFAELAMKESKIEECIRRIAIWYDDKILYILVQQVKSLVGEISQRLVVLGT